MIDNSDWYRDPTSVVQVLQRVRRRPGAPQPLIPGYETQAEIRRGGQGAVYAAVQQSTRRRVAVKVLLGGAMASQQSRRRFEREVELVASLRHPHIVSVYDSGSTADGSPYLVMELVEGAPLDQWIEQRGRRGEAGRAAGAAPGAGVEADLRLFARLCDAVAFAHQHGVIHRDLKPGNILIDPAGQPRVLDFGIAKPLPADVRTAATQLTRPDGFVGTLAFAAPEQLTGEPAAADTRADVYSLGVILYLLLTGQHPFPTGGAVAELIRAVTQDAPPPPSLLLRGAGRKTGRLSRSQAAELDTIVLTATARDPQRRYQSAAALRDDVLRFLAGEPIEARRDSGWYVLQKTLRKYRAAAAVGLVFLASLLVYGVTVSLLYGRATQAEQDARDALAQATAERSRAEQEAERAAFQARKADRTAAFLREMLASADPYGSHGPDVTVREVLDAAATRVDSQLADQPQVAAGVHLAIGNAYRGLGLLEAAEPHLRAALETTRASEGDAHPDACTIRVDLAHVLRARGEAPAAEQMYREALAGYRASLGEQHPFVAHTSLMLGGLLVEQGRGEEAEPLYREAIALRRAEHGQGPHPDVAAALMHLGGLLYTRGQYDEAEAAYREALDTLLASAGQEHSAVAFCLNDLGLVLLAREQHAEAEDLLRQALELRTESLGPEHPDTALSELNLGVALMQGGQFAQAQPLLEHAHAVLERVFGPEHASTQRAASRLEELRPDRPR